jgi:peptide/nickel transport system substrate-binding protein
VLTLAIGKELEAWNTDLVRVTKGGGISFLTLIAHQRLVADDADFKWWPQLATEHISVEKGTWRINADNTMTTTWRIHENVKWHDGAPFTSDDLMFTFTVMTDREVPNIVGESRIMQRALAPDPYTFEIYWSGPYVRANEAPWLFPMPKHILEDTYQHDKASLPGHPWLTTEFVGVGPYRLARWEQGSHMEFARFDDYFRGRPPLDRVVMRFITDPNTMVAALLAEDIDVIPQIPMELDTALEIKRRWEGTGNRTSGGLTGRFITVETQHRAEFARPVDGLATKSVRQAFYQAMDREQLTEAITGGLAPAADSWFFPSHELRPEVEAFIPRFPYDVGMAQRLLEQAGWTRGRDGVLTNRQTGEPLTLTLGEERAAQRTGSIVADYWRAAGARVDEVRSGGDSRDDLEAQATLSGAWMGTQAHDNMFTDRFHSSNIAGPGNRWTGRNRSGYNNPKVDALLDRLVATIAAPDRLTLHRELLREQLGDLVVMPLHWEYQPYFALKSVGGGVNGASHNFFEWDKQ